MGSTADDAKGALDAEGFKYNLTYQYSSSVAQGTVISQSATSAKSGATITLVVSNGPDPATSGANNTNSDTTTNNTGGTTKGTTNTGQ